MSLIDTARIAAILSVSQRHATDVITKRPDFPEPKMNVSRRLRRWDEDEVRNWAGLPAEPRPSLNRTEPQPSREAISDAVVR